MVEYKVIKLFSVKERVRAILINMGRIILIKRVKHDSTYFVFPGGGVEDGEGQAAALIRECKEELGLDVRVSKLLAERRYDVQGIEQNEYFYLCAIEGGILGTGNGPEFQKGSNYEGSHEVVEVEVSKIDSINLMPANVKNKVVQLYSKKYD